jgi:hypothetical protein
VLDALTSGQFDRLDALAGSILPKLTRDEVEHAAARCSARGTRPAEIRSHGSWHRGYPPAVHSLVEEANMNRKHDAETSF